MLKDIVENVQKVEIDEIVENDVEEVLGDKDVKNKKMAKKTAKAKSKVKCSGNMTPSKVPTSGGTVKFKCTPKDKVKARKMKKVRVKFNKTAGAQKAKKKAKLTKDFRK